MSLLYLYMVSLKLGTSTKLDTKRCAQDKHMKKITGQHVHIIIHSIPHDKILQMNNSLQVE